MSLKENIKTILELSPMQLTILLESLAIDENTYKIQSTADFPYLDLELIENSFNKVVERHDALRTIFVYENTKKPLQIVLKEKHYKINYQDYSEFPYKEAVDKAKIFANSEYSRTFRLNKETPFLISIVKISSEHFRVIITAHHIILDAWSMSIVENEVSELYAALANNQEFSLDQNKQIEDYIKWIQRQETDKAINYWKTYLNSYKTLKPYYKKQSFESINNSFLIHQFSIGKDLKKLLNQLVIEKQSSIANVVSLIYGLSLAKYYDRSDIVFGNIISGRAAKLNGIESIVGLLTNTIPQRVQFKESDRLEVLLKQIYNESIDHNNCSFIPLAKLQTLTHEKVNVFEHLLDFISTAENEKIDNITEQFGTTNFNFTLLANPTNDDLYLNFIYNPKKYNKEHILLLERYLLEFMKSICEDCIQMVSEIKEPDDLLYYECLRKSDFAENFFKLKFAKKLALSSNAASKYLSDYFEIDDNTDTFIIPLEEQSANLNSYEVIISKNENNAKLNHLLSLDIQFKKKYGISFIEITKCKEISSIALKIDEKDINAHNLREYLFTAYRKKKDKSLIQSYRVELIDKVCFCIVINSTVNSLFQRNTLLAINNFYSLENREKSEYLLSSFTVDTSLTLNDKKTKSLNTKIEKEDFEEIKQFAKIHDLSLSEYFRGIAILLLNDYFQFSENHLFLEQVYKNLNEESQNLILLSREFFTKYKNSLELIKCLSSDSKKLTAQEKHIIIKQSKSIDLFFSYIYIEEECSVYNLNELTENAVELLVYERADDFLLSLQLNEANFRDFSFLGRLLSYSKQIIRNVSIEWKDLKFVHEYESEQLLKSFNSNKVKFPVEKDFATIFEEKVKKYPEKIALSFNQKDWSYNELNQRANQFAHFLKKNNVSANNVIALLMKRSDLMLVTILGIFKAGAAYLPIDEEYPDDRIKYILDNAEVKLIVTNNNKNNHDLLKKYNSIDISAIELENESVDNLAFKRSAENLSYIIFTSGSTGKPKGAMLQQKGMVNHLFAKITDLKLTEKSVVAQNASHCFDISVWQYLVALLVGGKTIVYDNEVILDPLNFIKLVNDDKITILELVPSYLNLLLELLESDKSGPDYFSNINYLMVTGEVLKHSLVNRWFRYIKTIPLVNAYGPTEASDDITHHFIDSVTGEKHIPIGKPVSNMTIFILNHHDKYCPVGMKGEICVSGIGVGKGYINNTEKTNEVFVKDLISENKMYRTGDLGAWNQDGIINFYGRKDFQVKIRGFRIELGEIEAAVASYNNVTDVVVIVYTVESEEQLVAYISGEFEVEKLRKHLQHYLPDYMVPSFIIKMDQLPLNENGKIDRKKLPLPSVETTKIREAASETEKLLIKIWQDALKLNDISINSDFFSLAGDSLKAMSIIHKLKLEGYDVISIADIYELLTIENIAKKIDSTLVKNIEIRSEKDSHTINKRTI